MYRVLYFIYVVLTTVKHWRKFYSFSRFYSQKYNRSQVHFLLKAYMQYLKYGMHPIDYFYFDVYGNKEFNSSEYASTLFMYRFNKKVNNKAVVNYFLDKRLFNKHFKDFMGHKSINIKGTSINEIEEWIKKANSDSLMIKKAKGLAGIGVKRLRIVRQNGDIYINNKVFEDAFVDVKKYDILEEFVVQHEDINRINSSCLNTVRIITAIDKFDKVNILGAVLRLGVEGDVDNFHAGGIAVNIDVKTGSLEGEGFKLKPSAPMSYTKHPITHVVLDGYVLPHWDLLVSTVKKAAHVFPEAKSIGWDVAITAEGVSLIEGNHNWDKIILQKALKRGIRKELETYL